MNDAADLPELPYLTNAICQAPWAVDGMVRAYGEACFRAGMERAARICDEREGRGDPYDATYDVAVGECAAAIRQAVGQ
jgi:hypothetical protein